MIWDERLITRQKAADMCGTWPLKVHTEDGAVFLRCGQCDMGITRLPAEGKLTDIDALIAAAVRHMVMSAHGYVLSGAGNEDRETDSGAAHGAGRSNGSRRAADLVH
jgi:hypothetical protein